MDAFHSTIALTVSSENTGQKAGAFLGLAMVELYSGNYAAGRNFALQSQRKAKLGENPHKETLAVRVEAICFCELGDYSRAVALFRRAISVHELCHMPGSELIQALTTDLAQVHGIKTKFSQARKLLSETLIDAKMSEGTPMYGHILATIAEIDAATGAPTDDIRRNLDVASQIYNKVGVMARVSTCATCTAQISI